MRRAPHGAVETARNLKLGPNLGNLDVARASGDIVSVLNAPGLPLLSGILIRPRAGRTQFAILVLLLLVTLVVSAVLTKEGSDAARAHEQTVERLLRDHAAGAAGRYVEQSEADVTSVLRALYMPYRENEDTFDPASFTVQNLPGVFDEQCNCNPEPFIDYHFAYDYRTDRFYTQKGDAPASDLRVLRSVLYDTVFVKLSSANSARIGGASKLGREATYALIKHSDVAGAPVFAVGFVGRPQMLGRMLTPVAQFNEQYWTAYTPKPDRFEISVVDGAMLIYQGNVQKSKFSAFANMDPPFGGFKVQAWINQRDVPLLAGTVVPSYRVPLFIGLLALSALLIIAVLFLFRREAELAEARSNFVAGVSHELRTPLAQIRMFTETLLLGRTRNDAERRRSLEIIDQEARRLTALVDNVLNLGRAERGAVRLAPAAAELAPIVQEVVDSFQQLPRARSLELRTELERRLIATVDTGAFRQILLNLLDNAAKYGPVGQRVIVGLAMFEETARLWVDDEGPGIPLRDRQRIFEPFYRSATHEADARVAGSGIGLAVVRELALLLGGTVRAEEAPGGGARMVVEFPEAYLRAEEAASNPAAVA